MIIYLAILFLLYLLLSDKKDNKFKLIKETYNNADDGYAYLDNIREALYDTQEVKTQVNKMRCISHIKPIIYNKGYLLEKPSINLVPFDNLVSSQKYYETGNYKWI